MSFWVLENTNNNYARIHMGNCRYCNSGRVKPSNKRAVWRGPFTTYDAAHSMIRSAKKQLSDACTACKPHLK
jgi:hypothetical protein